MPKKQKAEAAAEDRLHTVSDDGLAKTKLLGGSRVPAFNMSLVNQVMASFAPPSLGPEEAQQQLLVTVTGLAGIGPTDEIEGMLAGQMVAIHNATMESLRRAALPDQTFEGRRENLNHANKLSRTYALLLESLNKNRGKGQQKVTVEHVHVHPGGQAVVGNVTQGGGVAAKTEEQPHAKQIAYASEPPLWSMHAEGERMPVARDDERPLPNARRSGNRRTNG